MTGDGQLRAFIERILRLKEEQGTLAADIREVYAEAKGSGFDKTAMGQLVAHLRKVDKVGVAAVEEGQTVFDTYLSAYQRATGTVVATHTHDAASYAEATGREPVQEMHELPETAIQSGLPNEVRSGEPDASDAGTLGQVTSAPAGSGSDKMPATISDEGIPAFLKRERKALRPDCQHPDNCAGYGTHTCHACKKAMAEVEAA